MAATTPLHAEDHYDSGEVRDYTSDKPAVVQDVAEAVGVEERIRDIQVGLINVQDVADANGQQAITVGFKS